MAVTGPAIVPSTIVIWMRWSVLSLLLCSNE